MIGQKSDRRAAVWTGQAIGAICQDEEDIWDSF
jgi:hypothetical protein